MPVGKPLGPAGAGTAPGVPCLDSGSIRMDEP